jgi:hypothetical protein
MLKFCFVCSMAMIAYMPLNMQDFVTTGVSIWLHRDWCADQYQGTPHLRGNSLWCLSGKMALTNTPIGYRRVNFNSRGPESDQFSLMRVLVSRELCCNAAPSPKVSGLRADTALNLQDQWYLQGRHEQSGLLWCIASDCWYQGDCCGVARDC